MGRYTGSVCRICRRRGEKLYLKGERCNTAKCSISRRAYPPGHRGPVRKRMRKMSDYGIRLQEKQKARFSYGMSEKQFRTYFAKAVKQKGVTGDNFLKLLESRLDNFVFRVGFAVSRRQARQLITHGHFSINNQKVNVPSIILKINDSVKVREASSKIFTQALSDIGKKKHPSWYQVDASKKEAQLINLPSREEIDTPVDEQMIVEFYSR